MHGELLKPLAGDGGDLRVRHPRPAGGDHARGPGRCHVEAAGVPKLVLDIDLPRPRDVVGVQGDPAFGAYLKQLWSALDFH